MILYICVAALTISLAWFVQKTNTAQVHMQAGAFLGGRKQIGTTRQQYLNRACLGTIFLILFLVSACRFKVGNDYKRYLEFFRLIYRDQYVPTEAGFNWIVRLMQAIFGSETYLSIFALFALLTIGLMLYALYELSEDFFFSFFLFMCFSYYFQSMNTVRYYLAIAIAMVSIQFIFRREYLKFMCCILLASLMHKSVLIVIPIYLIAVCPWKKWFVAVMSVAAASGLVLGSFYMKVILFLYPTYENTDMLEGGTSITNIVRCAAVLVLGLLYYKSTVRENVQIRFYFHLNYIALLLYTCCSFLPEISRIGYYLTVGQVFLLPMIVERIPDIRQKKILRLGIMAAAVVYFAAFLHTADYELIKLLPYQTWFFEPRFEFTVW
ncbi:MAG: EpsG family protein [Lachnospiraceae bacterium]|nr:EpsG family protein [Lachnospiraceae bacterium]